MELYQLKTFIAVADTANLTRAAARLNHSPSAVSSQIKALEAHLDLTLFHRTSRGMALTAHGKALIPRAREILGAAKEFENQAKKHARNARIPLAIGVNTDPGFLRLPDLIQKAAQRLPKTDLTLTETQSVDTPSSLRKKTIDIGFHFGPINARGVQSLHLLDTPIQVILPKAFAQTPPHWEALAALPWVWTQRRCPYHLAFVPELEKRGLKIRTVAHAENEAIVEELIKSNLGAALARRDQAQEMIHRGDAIPWEGEYSLSVPLAASWLTDRSREPGLAEFIRLLRESKEKLYINGT